MKWALWGWMADTSVDNLGPSPVIDTVIFLKRTVRLIRLLHSILITSLLKLEKVKVNQLCTTLCDPMDYTVHEIL